MMVDLDDEYDSIVKKYNFSFQDYNDAMDIFERAFSVDKLEELLDQREEFDWSQVPKELPWKK